MFDMLALVCKVFCPRLYLRMFYQRNTRVIKHLKIGGASSLVFKSYCELVKQKIPKNTETRLERPFQTYPNLEILFDDDGLAMGINCYLSRTLPRQFGLLHIPKTMCYVNCSAKRNHRAHLPQGIYALRSGAEM